MMIFDNQSRKLKKEEKLNQLELKRIGAKVGTDLGINGRIHIYCEGKLSIGDNVNINSGIDANPAAGMGQTSILFKQIEGVQIPELIIGNRVGISNTAFTIARKIVIEDMVAIGAGCMISDTDYHSLNLEKRYSILDNDIKVEPITIRYGAFIGARSIILKGVTIGERSVIGAGSVVTKDIPPGEIWAGNPARFIKKLDET